MTIEIAALLMESLSTATSIISEVKKKRDAVAEIKLVGALYELDASTALNGISDAALAAQMRGAMKKRHTQIILEDAQVRRLLSEIVLTALVEDQESSTESIRSMIQLRIGFLLKGQVAQEDSAHFTNGLLKLVTQFCRQALDSALEIAPDAVLKVHSLNLAKRTQAILLRISDQSDALARILSPDLRQEREDFYSDYRKICADVHGSIQPPDFETNQRVPLEEIYVGPTIFDLSEDADQAHLNVAQLLDSIDRTVVLGDPGGGKSTLSNYLTMTWAHRSKAPVPFHITLREFAPVADSLSILQFIERQFPSKYQIEPPEGAVGDTLIAGEAVVIFDGLDELIDPTKRRSITTAVETFGIRYPLAKILVTSRRVGYEQARLDPSIFRLYKIDGFSPDDVGEYVQKWFASQTRYSDDEAKRLSVQFMAQSSAVSDLSSNPLMLALMCIIFRGESFIPRNRPAIYEKCATLLFEKWDGHRQIEVPLRARDHVDTAMKHFAFLYLESGASDTGIPRAELVREMTSYLYPRAMETREGAERAAEEFVEFCAGRAWVFSDAGTTADGEPIFTFTHRTFMEYFAAVHLVRTSESPEKLARTLLPRIAREEWDVVAQLAIQQSDKSHDQGTERALRSMLREPRKRSVENRGRILNFIARCCQFAVISPALLREISAACLSYFLSSENSSDSNFDELRPWLTLQASVPEEQIVPTIEAQRELLLEIFHSPQHPLTDNSVYLCFLGLVRRFNGRTQSERNWSPQWDEMFRDILAIRPSPVEETLNSNPPLWIYLILGGMISPRDGLAEMKASALSFYEIYLTTPVLNGENFATDSLVALIHSAFERAEQGRVLNDVEILTAVAEEFLRDFSEMDVVRIDDVSIPDDERKYLRPLSPSLKMMQSAQFSQSMLDFMLLSSAAVFELRHSDSARAERRITRRSDSETTAASELESLESSASGTAFEFASAWLAGNVNFFDTNSGGKNPQSD